MSCFNVDELFFSLDLYHPLWLIIPITFPSFAWGFSGTKKTKLSSLETESHFALKFPRITYLIPHGILRELFSHHNQKSLSVVYAVNRQCGRLVFWSYFRTSGTETWIRKLKVVGATTANSAISTTMLAFLLRLRSPLPCLSLHICKIRIRTSC